MRARGARASNGVNRGEHAALPERAERRKCGMQTEEPIQVERRLCPRAGPRNGDGRTKRVVIGVRVRHDHVQRVGGSPLEENDQDLPARSQAQLAGERRASQEARTETERDERECAGAKEYSALHRKAIVECDGLRRKD